MLQTVKNMGMILNKVDLEVAKANLHAAKTLMNTYKTLLKQVENSNEVKFKYRLILLHHLERIEAIHTTSNLKIGTSIRQELYKNADILALVSERANDSICSLRVLTRDSSSEGSKYGMNDQRLYGHVGIISPTSFHSNKHLEQLVDEYKLCNNFVKHEMRTSSFITKDLTIKLLTSDTFITGFRFNHIYIHIDTPLSVIKSIKSMNNIEKVQYFIN